MMLSISRGLCSQPRLGLHRGLAAIPPRGESDGFSMTAPPLVAALSFSSLHTMD